MHHRKVQVNFGITPTSLIKSLRDLISRPFPCRFTKVNLNAGTGRADFAIAKSGIILSYTAGEAPSLDLARDR